MLWVQIKRPWLGVEKSRWDEQVLNSRRITELFFWGQICLIYRLIASSSLRRFENYQIERNIRTYRLKNQRGSIHQRKHRIHIWYLWRVSWKQTRQTKFFWWNIPRISNRIKANLLWQWIWRRNRHQCHPRRLHFRLWRQENGRHANQRSHKLLRWVRRCLNCCIFGSCVQDIHSYLSNTSGVNPEALHHDAEENGPLLTFGWSYQILRSHSNSKLL